MAKPRKGSRNLRIDLTINGRRIRRSLKTDDGDSAEIRAAEIRKQAYFGDLITKKPEIRATEAFGRIWTEHSQFLPSRKNAKYRLTLLDQFFGPHILLSEITPALVVTYIAGRRVGHSPISVNGDLLCLKQVILRARDIWKVAIPDFNVRKLLLPEPDYRQHILTPSEEQLFFRRLRYDMEGMVCFAMATGLRLSNVIYLKWDQIKWELGHIEFHVKSKKEGGKLHIVPLTEFVVHLLEAERGNNEEYVFTMIARKDHTNWITGERFVKGERYPYTRSEAWRKPWQQALTRAGLWEKGSDANFRFHDLRHTAATRLYKATHNLKVVQKFLGHANIQMTMRYLGVDVDDVKNGMDLIAPAHFGHTPKRRNEKIVRAQ